MNINELESAYERGIADGNAHLLKLILDTLREAGHDDAAALLYEAMRKSIHLIEDES